MKYQGFGPSSLTEDEAAGVREMFDAAVKRRETTRKVGRMKLKALPGEYRYAVAIRDGDDLWLTLWIRRSPRGEFFVFQPRGERDWNPHFSYHLDGTAHSKSYGQVMLPPQKRQPLTGPFRGNESLGAYGGHGPKTVGAVCDPQDYSAVFEVAPGLLGPKNGTVVVDLLAPGADPLSWPGTEGDRRLFTDVVPNVLIRIFPSS
jgi:hypothetical protein